MAWQPRGSKIRGVYVTAGDSKRISSSGGRERDRRDLEHDPLWTIPTMIGAFASYVIFGFVSDRMAWTAARRSHSTGVLVIAFARDATR